MSSWPREVAQARAIRQRLVPSTSTSGARRRHGDGRRPVASARRSARAARGSRGAARVARPGCARASARAAGPCPPVRLGGDRHDHAATLARHAVRTDVLLDADPRRGSSSCSRTPAASHSPVEPAGVVRRLGKRQVEHVVGTARVELRTLVARRRRRTGGRPGPPAARPRRCSGRRGTAGRRPSRRAYQWGSHRLAA